MKNKVNDDADGALDQSMDSADDTINEGRFKTVMEQLEPKLYDESVDLSEKLSIIHTNLQLENWDKEYYLSHLSYLRRLMGAWNIEIAPIVYEFKMLSTLSQFFEVSFKKLAISDFLP